jgi:6,7-dimethyl-8-ribityllumazine synthase
MSSSHHNLSTIDSAKLKNLDNAKIAVITAAWNQEITYAMRDACLATLNEFNCPDENIIKIEVPGAFELPSAAKMLLANQKLDAVICIGCVIRGETKHDEYISNAVASGIMTLSIASGKPVIFGVLTPNDMQQALDRAGGKYGNKGVEAAHTAIQMIHLANEVKNIDKKKIGF